MRVVVTGAAGKTGRAVVAGLRRAGHEPVAVVRRESAAREARGAGLEVRIADFADATGLTEACRGADAVYHIPPNMHPDEEAVGARMADAALAAGVRRFILHSVLAPYLPEMPHHQRKARTELALRRRPLQWSIVQPASYAQNLLPYLDAARTEGRYRVPYRATAPFTPVDLDDVADVAVVLLENEATIHGTFELCGPQRLDSRDQAAVLTQLVGREVEAESQSPQQWRTAAAAADSGGDGRTLQELDDLAAMFDWYDRFGLAGSDVVLRGLLGRRPTDLASALQRDMNRSDTVT